MMVDGAAVVGLATAALWDFLARLQKGSLGMT
jgi:hypothetical protein